jgi:hypothetical protein
MKKVEVNGGLFFGQRMPSAQLGMEVRQKSDLPVHQMIWLNFFFYCFSSKTPVLN